MKWNIIVCGYFCRLLIAFANSLEPDQGHHLVGPDLGQDCLLVFLKYFFENFNFEKIQQAIKKRTQHYFSGLRSKQRANNWAAVKPALSDHAKIDKTKLLKTKGSLMKVLSIAECSHGAFCNTFDLY